jgi:MarR family transcriptional regulator, organic hydroperoxide resistance regulator
LPAIAGQHGYIAVRGDTPEEAVKDPTKLDLDNYLPFLVNRVGIIIAEQYGGEALAPHGLSIPMWRVMAVLASKGSQRQIDLAEYTSIEVSTLSRIVTRLVRIGVVSRTRSTSNTREVVVKLTAKGNAQVSRLIVIAHDYEAVATAGLRADEIAVLKNALRRIFANMRERAASLEARTRRGRTAAQAAE